MGGRGGGGRNKNKKNYGDEKKPLIYIFFLNGRIGQTPFPPERG